MYYGAMFLILLFLIYGFYISRDYLSSDLILFVTCTVLLQLSLDGYFSYLSFGPIPTPVVNTIFVNLAAFFNLRFISRLLRIGVYNPKLNAGIKWFSYALLLNTLLAFIPAINQYQINFNNLQGLSMALIAASISFYFYVKLRSRYDLLVSISYLLLSLGIVSFIGSTQYFDTDSESMRMYGLKVGFLMQIIVLTYALSLYLKKGVNDKQKVKEDLLTSQLISLKSQINPHFIFNSLTSLQYLILANERGKSVEYLGRFSSFMRRILNNSNELYTTVEDEMKLIGDYLELEQSRFNDKFSYEIVVDDKIDQERIIVPTLLLYPYIENSIIHGFNGIEYEGYIKVEIVKHGEESMIISLTDNGIGREKAGQNKEKQLKKHKSYGVSLSSDRVALINKTAGVNITVDIKDMMAGEKSMGTKIEIQLPLLTEEVKSERIL